MDVADLFVAFEQLLSEEREAIRHLDGKKVEAIAQRKIESMSLVTALPKEVRSKHVKDLRALAASLRRNGILLIHARGIIRDTLRIKGAQLHELTPGFGRPQMPNVQMSRPRLSVRG